MKPVLLEIDHASGIATLTLNRPEVLNAIDLATGQALLEAAQTLRADGGARCVIVRGAGRAFAAGGDMAAFAADFSQAGKFTDALLDVLIPSMMILREIDAPLVASVQGAVAGAGLSLMASCDLIVAAEGTKFLTAYDKVGAIPDWGGTYFLPRKIGLHRAAQMFLLSEPMGAVEALSAGLVNWVVPADQLAAFTAETARKVAAGPTKAHGYFKRLATRTFDTELHAQLEAERAAFKTLTAGADFREGVSAFLAKRAPKFTGK